MEGAVPSTPAHPQMATCVAPLPFMAQKATILYKSRAAQHCNGLRLLHSSSHSKEVTWTLTT